jgi:hypothetical protein
VIIRASLADHPLFIAILAHSLIGIPPLEQPLGKGYLNGKTVATALVIAGLVLRSA